MEFAFLLDKANLEQDPLVRLAYITTFNIAQYSSVEGRKQKPFNPVIGETYELLTPEYRFAAEQVCHHPPISACNA
jgi:oxysterol-binding protein 1